MIKKVCVICGKEFISTGYHQKYCKECRVLAKKEQDKKRQKANPEKARAASKKWREANLEKANASQRKYYKANSEKRKEAHKKWKKNNREQYLELERKSNNKRHRNLGFVPLNEWFKGSVSHHVNKNYVIYIPEELHRSIWHRQGDWNSMLAINKLAFQYLIDNG